MKNLLKKGGFYGETTKRFKGRNVWQSKCREFDKGRTKELLYNSACPYARTLQTKT